jgi:hypothetical protein
MSWLLRWCATASVLLMLLLSVSVSQASIVVPVSDWTRSPVQDQDKLYTLLADTALPPSTEMTFETYTFPGLDLHTVNNSALGPGIYQLNYSVEITSSGRFFDTVSLDSDVPRTAPDVLVTKKVYGPQSTLLTTLTSLSGVPSALYTFPLGLTKIWINETFRVDQGDVPGKPGVLNSSTNDYTQQVVIPEPAAIVVWTLLGTVAVSWGVWRQRLARARRQG